MSAPPANTALLVLDGVRFGYTPEKPVVESATFEVRRGEMLGLVGPSGSGKTTLLQLLGGLLRPQAGHLLGRPELGDVRWVFQVPTALGRRTVADNVRIGLHALGLDPEEAAERVRRSLADVGLADLTGRRAGSLSGGELQRLQIARALTGEPPLVLADEPTGQLDHRSTVSVVTALRTARRTRSTVVLATHDPELARACDRRLAVLDGRVAEVSS